MIYLISGSGTNAGKSTFAAKLVGKANVWALADALRFELQAKYPGVDWFNLSQEYKENTHIKFEGHNHMSLRTVMVTYAESVCAGNPRYWVDKLVDRLQYRPVQGPIAIEGLRKCIELDILRAKVGVSIHFHVSSAGAVDEGNKYYDNEELSKRADYRVEWGGK